MSGLPRVRGALIQDRHTHKAWEEALRPLDASAALECEETYGVYIEYLGEGEDEGVRLHVPSLGSTMQYELDDALEQESMIRAVVDAAAHALGIFPTGRIGRHVTVSYALEECSACGRETVHEQIDVFDEDGNHMRHEAVCDEPVHHRVGGDDDAA